MEKLMKHQVVGEASYSDRNEIRKIVEEYLRQKTRELKDYESLLEEQKKIESIVEQTIF